MSRVSDIEKAVTQLAPDDLARFREWFARYDAEQWDRQIERDVEGGRLDDLAEEALRDLQSGHCKDL